MKTSCLFPALLGAALAAACSSGRTTQNPESGTPNQGTAGTAGTTSTPGEVTPQDNPVDDTFAPTAEQALNYMRYLGPALLGRVLNDEEEAEISANPAGSFKPLIEEWVTEPGFVEAVRSMMEVRLGTNGKRGQVDFNLAGNIVAHVVKNARPWSEVVTSNTCYDDSDQAMACDTGAPYTAGVLTTRGFLAGNEGRFNLGRARAMLLTFMCRDYPANKEIQPYIEKTKLKLMFRAENAEEQQVAEVAGGFGNGLQCFVCHGQFSSHSQPFVKFDKAGTYKAEATGLQSMKGQLGESDDGLMASHFESPADAKLEAAQWFGVNINNLAEGAAVMGKHPKFQECAVQQLLDLGVGLDLGFSTAEKGLVVLPEFLDDIASQVRAKNPDPTIQELAIAAYSDARVIAATLNGLKR